MSIVITSGYFDPLHVGHLEYLALAATYGKLVVIVNNDRQAKLKKGRAFMSETDRLRILSALRCVHSAILSIDDDTTVCQTLRLLRGIYRNEELIFAKGGDRHKDEIPEQETCSRLHIKVVDGLGVKIRSSSDLLKEYKRVRRRNSHERI